MLKASLVKIVLAAVLSSVAVANRTYGQTQSELTAEQCAKFNKADEELNATYREVLRLYSGEHEFVDKLTAAQRTWIEFRDAHLASLFPVSEPGEYGSVLPMCECMILTRITEDRRKELALWLEGYDEGEVCGGSIPPKRWVEKMKRLLKRSPQKSPDSN